MSFRKKSNKKTSLPSLRQWRKLPTILSKKEKRIFFIFVILFVCSTLFLASNFYLNETEIKAAIGGTHIEGLVGQPRFINPVYAIANDTDRDLAEIIYSGLMKYDNEGKLVKDLAESFEVKDEGKTYEFKIKENVLWSDGEKLTADDIIFTIKTIQNSDYKSPLRAEWLGVEVEKVSEYQLRFKLSKPSFVFLESTTLKILPKHIWNKISLENFSLSNYNLEPIGSGPYQFKEIDKEESGFINSVNLERNPNYYNEGPFISELEFRFYQNEEELIKAVKKKEVDGVTLENKEYYNDFSGQGFTIHSFTMPRYFAIFFNTEREILENEEIRKALSHAINKDEILNEALLGKGEIVSSPIMPEVYGFSNPTQSYNYDIEKAKTILEEAGFEDLDGDGFREKFISKTPAFQFSSTLQVGSEGKEVEELQKCLAKDPSVYPEGEITNYFGNLTKQAVIRFQEKYASDILEPLGLSSGTGKVGNSTIEKLNEICFPAPEEEVPLEISLTTVDQKQLTEVANLIKNQWEEIGIKVEINSVDINTLEKDFIKPRDYDSLLFGEVLSAIPDPFPFWHSSQKKDPGLNLSLYENEEVDSFLEKGRASSDFEVQKDNYEKFQEIILEEAPAIFLYSPSYIYVTNSKIKGINNHIIIDPSKRFSEINKWFVETKRTWDL
jgi:peptide/nickel transport system substrate-binding protein